jgi:peptidoglycan-associated lipoprotein
MGARLLSLLAVLVIVAGCSKKEPETGMITTDGDLSQQTTTSMTDSSMTAGQQTPGSAQDFVVNVGDRVFFGYDQYDLSGEARTQIERQAQWLKQYPNVTLIVEGHCDERGSDEYNIALGRRRAEAAKRYLTDRGVDASRIETASFGRERPAVQGTTEEAWSRNRRDEFELIAGGDQLRAQ